MSALPLATILCLPTLVLAQASDEVEFNLFEGVENNRTEQPVRRERASRERDRNTQPEFTLVGTSRIGNSYSAILLHRGGNPVYIRDIDPQANTRITGHIGYTIVHAGPGTVSIRYPDGDPCVEATDKAVSCSSAGNIAFLGLTNKEPVANQAPIASDASEGADGDEEAQEDVPVNPFEALRAARENGNEAAQQANPDNNRFTPRRIAPEDVPPGYRVVSTPFGDRLIEQ